MARVLVEACYPPNAPLLNRPDELIARLTSRRPSFFDTNGERLGGTGEHVVVLLPGSQPKMLTYRRGSNRTWERVSEVPLSKGKPGGVRP